MPLDWTSPLIVIFDLRKSTDLKFFLSFDLLIVTL
jgi:hypothetical protein